jgi:hypothetical protein
MFRPRHRTVVADCQQIDVARSMSSYVILNRVVSFFRRPLLGGEKVVGVLRYETRSLTHLKTISTNENEQLVLILFSLERPGALGMVRRS